LSQTAGVEMKFDSSPALTVRLDVVKDALY